MAFMETIDKEFKSGLTFDQVVERHKIPKLHLAKFLLHLCDRTELCDHAFGDREVSWWFGETEVAGGYFGMSGESVWIYVYMPDQPLENQCETMGSFSNKEARELLDCGRLTKVERNDSQGE